MCFSATASFVAGGALSTAGVATITTAKKHELPLASIPALFGIQQGMDGIVWITSDVSRLHIIATYIYALFAFVFWPVFTPFAIYLTETDHVRKRILLALLIMGGAVSSFFLYGLITKGATAQTLQNCIAYAIPLPYGMVSLAFYLVVVCGSFFASSKLVLRIFGVVLLISFGIAGWFYETTFSSTWCFFAALLSAILVFYFHTRSRTR